MRSLYLLIHALIIFCTLNSCKQEDVPRNLVKRWFKGGEGKTNSTTKLDSIHVFHGKYSAHLKHKNDIAFYTIDSTVSPNDIYKIQVWKLSNSYSPRLVVEGPTKNDFYSMKHRSDSSKGDWKLITHTVHIPPNYKGDFIRFYVTNPKGKEAYFDNFEVQKIKRQVFPTYNTESLQLRIDKISLDILKKRRLQAFQDGYLSSVNKQWVNAKIKLGGKWKKAKIKLKGDRLIHLQGAKWSFKIKLNETWKGMKIFSIHKPEARAFLKEWKFHEVLKQNGIRTANYGFIPVSINNNSLGVFAWQEHFSNMVNMNNTILGFDDELFWKNRLLEKNKEVISFAKIKVHGKQHIKDSLPICILKKYQNYKANLEEEFNLDKLATYFALVDLFEAYHGDYWINQKFLYNYKTNKMEIVGHDGYTVSRNFTWPNLKYWGGSNVPVARIKSSSKKAILTIIQNPSFRKKYEQKLQLFSTAEFINKFVNGISEKEKEYFQLLLTEYPYLKREEDRISIRGKELQTIISKIDPYR